MPSHLAQALPPPPPRWADRSTSTGAGSGAPPPPEFPGAAPATRHQAWRWFFLALGGFVVGQLLGLVFGSVAGDVAGKSAAQMKVIETANVPPEWFVMATLVGLWIGFVGAPWLASRTQGTRRFLADLGVRFKAVDLWGIAIGVGGQLGIGLLYLPFQHLIHNFNAPTQKLTGSSHGGGFWVIALATVLLAPFAEELFFRGLLFRGLLRLCTSSRAGNPVRNRGLGIAVAIILDGVLFGLAHGEWVQLAGLALFGMVLAYISLRTERLGMNMVSHASFNLVVVLSLIHQQGGVIH